MPAQALIRHLSKTEITAAIAKLKAGESLEITTRPDGSHLVSCKPGEGGAQSAVGAPEALQAVCDLDALEVRRRELELKKKEEEEKAAAAKKATETKPSP